jgi:hypothetical protein
MRRSDRKRLRREQCSLFEHLPATWREFTFPSGAVSRTSEDGRMTMLSTPRRRHVTLSDVLFGPRRELAAS